MKKALASIIAHSELAIQSLEECQEPYEKNAEDLRGFDFNAHISALRKDRSLKHLIALLGEARMVSRSLLEGSQ